MALCPHCRNALPETETRHCPNCGGDVGAAVSPPPPMSNWTVWLTVPLVPVDTDVLADVAGPAPTGALSMVPAAPGAMLALRGIVKSVVVSTLATRLPVRLAPSPPASVAMTSISRLPFELLGGVPVKVCVAASKSSHVGMQRSR